MGKVNSDEEYVRKEFKRIDDFFRELEQDTSLPTFGDHFMLCLILGTAKNVNLQKMYPKTYFRLSKFLEEHNEHILAARKEDRKR